MLVSKVMCANYKTDWSSHSNISILNLHDSSPECQSVLCLQTPIFGETEFEVMESAAV
jgi:hypothetical protein